MWNTRLLIAVCTGIALIAGVLLWRDREPRFHGVPLKTLLTAYAECYAENPESAETEQASEMIRSIARVAIPKLLIWIHYEDTPWRQKLRRLITKLPSPCINILDPLLDRPEIRATLAERAFKALGCQASNAVPALVELLTQTNSPDTAVRATYALAWIGKPALPLLLEVISNEKRANRDLAAYALANMGDLGMDAAPAIPLLLQSLSDRDAAVAEMAALALGEIALQPASVVPALSSKLKDPNQRLRERATYSLARFGEAARPAIPMLLSALNDGDTNVCSAAEYALSCIDAATINAVQP